MGVRHPEQQGQRQPQPGNGRRLQTHSRWNRGQRQLVRDPQRHSGDSGNRKVLQRACLNRRGQPRGERGLDERHGNVRHPGRCHVRGQGRVLPAYPRRDPCRCRKSGHHGHRSLGQCGQARQEGEYHVGRSEHHRNRRCQGLRRLRRCQRRNKKG